MFAQDRDSLRRFYSEAWQKYQQQQMLSSLEQQIVAVISEHPEYQTALNSKNLQQDFFPEGGSTNPFLHMGLHLGLREQIATDRPAGIRSLYEQLCQQGDVHQIEHKMMDCLAESIWLAQRNNTLPDEVAYLEQLKQIR